MTSTNSEGLAKTNSPTRVHELIVENELPDVSIYAQQIKPDTGSPSEHENNSKKPLNLMSLKSRGDGRLPPLANSLVIGIGSNAAGVARISQRQQLLLKGSGRESTSNSGQNVASQPGMDPSISLSEQRTAGSEPSLLANMSKITTAPSSSDSYTNDQPSAPQEVFCSDRPDSPVENGSLEQRGHPDNSSIADDKPNNRISNIRERLKALRALQSSHAAQLKQVLDDGS